MLCKIHSAENKGRSKVKLFPFPRRRNLFVLQALSKLCLSNVMVSVYQHREQENK